MASPHPAAPGVRRSQGGPAAASITASPARLERATPWLTRCLLTLDGFVFEGHRSGWLQSLVIHTSVLLVLALVVVRADRPRRTELVLDFSSQPPEEPSSDAADIVLPLPGPEELSAVGEIDVDMAPEPDLAADEPQIAEIELTSFTPPDLLTPPIDSLVQQIGAPTLTRVPPVGAGAAHGESNRGHSHAGEAIGGELGRRLRAKQAGTGDVQISICWQGLDDIDVHVTIEPLHTRFFSTINWMRRRGACGGLLDVDANASFATLTPTPVENVFWSEGAAPFGRYTVTVHHFARRSHDPHTPVEVAVLVDGNVTRFHPVVTYGSPPVVVTTFVRTPPGFWGDGGQNSMGIRATSTGVP